MMTEYGIRYRKLNQGADEWFIGQPKLSDHMPITANDPIYALRSSLDDATTLAASYPRLTDNHFSAEIVPLESVYDHSDHDNTLMHEVLKRRVKIHIEGDDYNVIDCSLERLENYAALAIQSHRQKIKELQDSLDALKKENEELNSEKVSLGNRLWDDQKRVKELTDACNNCLEDLLAIKRRNQGGYVGDRDAVIRQIGRLTYALSHTDNELSPDSAVPTNDSLSGAASVVPAATGDRDDGTGVKYWDAPWCQGVWWNEFNDYAIYYHLIDPAMDYGKGRWVKIEKPVFPPQRDPLDENIKSIIAALSNVDDLTRDVGAIIKKHFADWEPKE